MDVAEGRPGPVRRVTLADVARHAGVSPALASIVMRDAPGASPASRQRILAVASQLGYRPDVRARSLASLKPHLIGVLFGKSGRFHLDLIDGLYGAAESRGWDLVLSALTDNRDERRALQSLQDFHFDALVMLGPAVVNPGWPDGCRSSSWAGTSTTPTSTSSAPPTTTEWRWLSST